MKFFKLSFIKKIFKEKSQLYHKNIVNTILNIYNKLYYIINIYKLESCDTNSWNNDWIKWALPS